ncbi:MAG: putative damage-inducible protein DinB [Pseudohongiellaceae bacterium]
MGAAFLRQSIEFLRDDYLPRIERALAALPADDLWWRANDGALSAGTILLHLTGNVQQWIVSGLGGAADQRHRASELSANGGSDAAALFERLTQTVQAACTVIAEQGEAELTQPLVLQGFPTSPLQAMYHVVEHFSWHTGQLVAIAKQRAGANHGISFYDDGSINAQHNEPT